ncbi:hypothetical protein DZF91_04910 [Actinomadura logoneensis]|uniref:Uncharacterized protein n=1 Tax=Actinomadura logoneensis TaxID=2293572 RepID=A0A372JSL2_9ACTN|nr:hypothetical protein [Actinomadura logoneensis]RFU42754.1 hypothetical protein DZF91_04910 [Actinomadura logoneensis]
MTDLIRPFELFDRLKFVLGLRALAAFLEENPGVPITRGTRDLMFFTNSDDCEFCQRAEIDRIAALLDVTPEDGTAEGGHYTATKCFGPLAYKAVFIPGKCRCASKTGRAA